MEDESDEMNRKDIEEVQEEVVEISSGIIKIAIDVEQPVNFLMKNESEVEEAEENVGAFLFIGAEKGNAAIIIGGIGSKELTEGEELASEEMPAIDSNHYIF